MKRRHDLDTCVGLTETMVWLGEGGLRGLFTIQCAPGLGPRVARVHDYSTEVPSYRFFFLA